METQNKRQIGKTTQGFSVYYLMDQHGNATVSLESRNHVQSLARIIMCNSRSSKRIIALEKIDDLRLQSKIPREEIDNPVLGDYKTIPLAKEAVKQRAMKLGKMAYEMIRFQYAERPLSR